MQAFVHSNASASGGMGKVHSLTHPQLNRLGIRERSFDFLRHVVDPFFLLFGRRDTLGGFVSVLEVFERGAFFDCLDSVEKGGTFVFGECGFLCRVRGVSVVVVVDVEIQERTEVVTLRVGNGRAKFLRFRSE